VHRLVRDHQQDRGPDIATLGPSTTPATITEATAATARTSTARSTAAELAIGAVVAAEAAGICPGAVRLLTQRTTSATLTAAVSAPVESFDVVIEVSHVSLLFWLFDLTYRCYHDISRYCQECPVDS
jgi:hypothetical protein